MMNNAGTVALKKEHEQEEFQNAIDKEVRLGGYVKL
jgi:hypothetical protein